MPCLEHEISEVRMQEQGTAQRARQDM